MVFISLEKITKKESRKKPVKEAAEKTKEDLLNEMHEFLIKTDTPKKKKNLDLKDEIKKAIKEKKEEITEGKRIIQLDAVTPHTASNYFQPPIKEVPMLDYEGLFSYIGSGVKEAKAAGYFEEQVKRIHASETTIERREAYAIIKETAWARTMGITLGHESLRNEKIFAYWAALNGALNIVMYSWSFSVNL